MLLLLHHCCHVCKVTARQFLAGLQDSSHPGSSRSANIGFTVTHCCFPDADTRSQAERQAVNSACQGSAADLVKLAMIQLHKKVLQELPADSCKLLLQVSHGHCQ